MASNAELIEKIKEINPEFEQGEMTNADMTAMLKDLKQSEPKQLRVPKGKAMTTLAGIKSEGEIITAAMVTGGDEKLQLLLKKGLLE
jgi:hypothetical protein